MGVDVIEMMLMSTWNGFCLVVQLLPLHPGQLLGSSRLICSMGHAVNIFTSDSSSFFLPSAVVLAVNSNRTDIVMTVLADVEWIHSAML